MALDYPGIDFLLGDEEEQRRNLYPAPAPRPPTTTAATPADAMAAAYPAPLPPRATYPAPGQPPSVARAEPSYAPVESNVPPPAAPQWEQYKPAEPHGWSKFGHIMATATPATNEYFNVRPERKAEQAYAAATGEYTRGLAQGAAERTERRAEEENQARIEEQRAQAEEQRAQAERLRREPIGKAAAEPTIQVGEETKQWNPETQRYDIPVGPAKAAKPTAKDQDIADYLEKNHLEDTAANRETARDAITKRGRDPTAAINREQALDERTYEHYSTQVANLRKPIADRMERFARLEDTINQGTPQADALIAPELLSVMAGGAASGLRMNEAEIARIVGGRTNWEALKAKVNAWELDPSKGFALTAPQRQQVRGLMQAAGGRLQKKLDAIDEGSRELLEAGGKGDTTEYRRSFQRLQKALTDIDRPQGAIGGPKEGDERTYKGATYRFDGKQWVKK